MDSSNSEVTGGIDAFAIGVAAVNPDAVIYVKVTNSWYDPVKEKSASRKLLDMGCDVMAQHCDTPCSAFCSVISIYPQLVVNIMLQPSSIHSSMALAAMLLSVSCNR